MSQQPLSAAAAADLVDTATGWELVEAHPSADGRFELRAAGHAFAVIGPHGAELELPPRVGAMLVETGRAEAQEGGARVLVRPDTDGLIDPDLLLLAYERARVAARATTR